MGFQHYFRLSWLAQLLVGCGLFTVSFLLQAQVLLGFIAVPALAWSLGITLELGKVLAIVWHRYMAASRQSYPASTRSVSVVFRTGLLLLSLICSLLYLGGQLDRPGLDAVRASDLQALEAKEKRQLERLENRRQKALSDLRHSHERAQARLYEARHSAIAALEKQLLKEMNNVVKGQFKGPRYHELERRLSGEKAALSTLVNESMVMLRQDENRLADRFDSYRAEAVSALENERRKIRRSRYLEDERVSDPRIIAFSNLTAALFGHRLSPVVFVFSFAVMLSVLLELGIVLAFDTVTAAMAPALHAQHQGEVDLQVFSSRVQAKSRRDEMANRASMEKIGKAAESALREADRVVADAR